MSATKGISSKLLILLLAAVWFLLGCGRQPDLSGRCRGNNLVLIVIDTLRADRLWSYGHPRSATLRLDEFSRGSLLFTKFIVSVGITLPSHVTTLAGLYPQSTGIFRNWGWLDDKYHTLAEILREAGCRTGAVVSTAVLQESKNLGPCFDEYRENFESGDWDPDVPDLAYRRKVVAADAFRMAGEFVEGNRSGPFFLFVNLCDVHYPFIVPNQYRGMFSRPDRRASLGGTGAGDRPRPPGPRLLTARPATGLSAVTVIRAAGQNRSTL